MIWYHVTNAEVGVPLKLSNVPCSQDDTAISLSTEVSCYGFGEWLHVCRLQAPLPDSVTATFWCSSDGSGVAFQKEENVLHRCMHVTTSVWEVNLVYNSERPM